MSGYKVVLTVHEPPFTMFGMQGPSFNPPAPRPYTILTGPFEIFTRDGPDEPFRLLDTRIREFNEGLNRVLPTADEMAKGLQTFAKMELKP